MKMYTIVFYSPGGGTGRTTALASTAYQMLRLLRNSGRSDVHVMIVDMDFEAPGLVGALPRSIRGKVEEEFKEGKRRSTYELLVWRLKPRREDIVRVNVSLEDGGEALLPALLMPVGSEMELPLLRGIYRVWGGVNTREMSVLTAWIWSLLHDFASRYSEMVNASEDDTFIALVDSRSGLALPSYSALAASYLTLVFTRVDSPSLFRLGEILPFLLSELVDARREALEHLRAVNPDAASSIVLAPRYHVMLIPALMPRSQAEEARRGLAKYIAQELSGLKHEIPSLATEASMNVVEALPFIEALSRFNAPPILDCVASAECREEIKPYLDRVENIARLILNQAIRGGGSSLGLL
jgi:hypothetical protein